jgi:hypothetical protein
VTEQRRLVCRKPLSAWPTASAVAPETFFKQIAEELRNSFELAYYPQNPVDDGTFRKIKVRPKREGVTIRSRPGYFAPVPIN